ncbi:MAG: hypothetical protein MR648_05000 [Clostridiales bacterium]|nr:hypothetical protein [Clostridiales bacterium]MDY4180980.1 hypothetical protein [Pseudoflavonifractor sp.]
MAKKIGMDDFESEMTALLEQAAQEKEESFFEILRSAATQTRGAVSSKSPRDTGDYAAGWKIRTEERNHEKVWVIYNAKKPWLTYILEYGTIDMVAKPHINPTLAEAVEEIVREIKERL